MSVPGAGRSLTNGTGLYDNASVLYSHSNGYTPVWADHALQRVTVIQVYSLGEAG